LYKCVKLDDGAWRYKRAAFYSNGKIKPNIVVVGKALRANIPETGLVLLINEQGEKEKGRYEFSWCCSFSWGFG